MCVGCVYRIVTLCELLGDCGKGMEITQDFEWREVIDTGLDHEVRQSASSATSVPVRRIGDAPQQKAVRSLLQGLSWDQW